MFAVRAAFAHPDFIGSLPNFFMSIVIHGGSSLVAFSPTRGALERSDFDAEFAHMPNKSRVLTEQTPDRIVLPRNLHSGPTVEPSLPQRRLPWPTNQTNPQHPR
jgi:hypothetical protein